MLHSTRNFHLAMLKSWTLRSSLEASRGRAGTGQDSPVRGTKDKYFYKTEYVLRSKFS